KLPKSPGAVIVGARDDRYASIYGLGQSYASAARTRSARWCRDDWGCALRHGPMQKAAAMLMKAHPDRVLKRFLHEPAKFNPYHRGPGPRGGRRLCSHI